MKKMMKAKLDKYEWEIGMLKFAFVLFTVSTAITLLVQYLMDNDWFGFV